MNFFAVLLALVAEQLKPLPHGNAVHQAAIAWVRWAGRHFDAGAPRHATLVWCITVLLPTLLMAALYAVLAHVSAVLALAYMVLVLYLTLGFRQFSHYYTRIRDALEAGNEAEARAGLAAWQHIDVSALPRTELLRHVIEYALLAAHRHVFGVFFWFIVLSTFGLGPAGAVLYRLAEFASRYWTYRSPTLEAAANAGLAQRCQQAFEWIDHVPARLTAAGFAIVGNFEDAVAGWRRDASLWQQPNEGVILASAAGAVNVQLGGKAAPVHATDRSRTFEAATDAEAIRAAGSTVGAPPSLGHLHSVVGLVWRSVILWMLLLALLTLANLLG